MLTNTVDNDFLLQSIFNYKSKEKNNLVKNDFYVFAQK